MTKRPTVTIISSGDWGCAWTTDTLSRCSREPSIFYRDQPSCSIGLQENHLRQRCSSKVAPNLRHKSLRFLVKGNLHNSQQACSARRKDSRRMKSQSHVAHFMLLPKNIDPYPIGSMVLLYIYMVTWIPSIYPLYVSIIYQHHGFYGY